jgi:thiol-disulfide isomerase/thioredoxin
MKPRWTLSVVGVVVLALAAAGVLRELSAPPDAGSASPADRKPRMSEAESPKPVPDLKFVDRTGAPRSLADFRGRFVLLNVWATWCTPCREEMPSLDRLQQTLGGADFEVVALSIDRGGVFAVESFYEELDLRALRVYVDSSAEALAKLRAPGIPMTVFVDRRGRELWRVAGPARWDDPGVVARIRGYLGPARDS